MSLLKAAPAIAGILLATTALGTGAALAQAKVAIVTPYMAQPGTQFYVEAFQGVAGEKVGMSMSSTLPAMWRPLSAVLKT